jgi:hypothetical protein
VFVVWRISFLSTMHILQFIVFADFMHLSLPPW